MTTLITRTRRQYRVIDTETGSSNTFFNEACFNSAMNDINEFMGFWGTVYNKDIFEFQVVEVDDYFDKTARFNAVPHPEYGAGDWRPNLSTLRVVEVKAVKTIKVSKKIVSWK